MVTKAIAISHLNRVFVKLRPIAQILRGAPRNEVQALKDVSFEVAPREIVALLGPTGAGKTTLLKILASLVTPSSGTAHVMGYDVRVDGPRVKSIMGYVVSDERSFYHRLTGRQNLEFFATLMDIDRSRLRQRVEEILDVVGLSEAAETMVKDYSSGMRQKLSIARGLLGDPRVILMDEPSRSLDPLFKERLRALVRKRLCEEEGRTVLLATHDLTEAQAIADRIAILHAGRLAAFGSLDDLLQRFKGLAIPTFEMTLGDGGPAAPFPRGVESTLIAEAGGTRTFRVTLRPGESIDGVVAHLVGCRTPVLAVVPSRPSLRDVLKSALEGPEESKRPEESPPSRVVAAPA